MTNINVVAALLRHDLPMPAPLAPGQHGRSLRMIDYLIQPPILLFAGMMLSFMATGLFVSIEDALRR